MDCSTPGFPVLYCLPEFAQTHVPWVTDVIQPNIRVFSSESALCIISDLPMGLCMSPVKWGVHEQKVNCKAVQSVEHVNEPNITASEHENHHPNLACVPITGEIDLCKLNLQYLGHMMWRADSLEKTLMLGKIEGRRRRGDRGWDGWMTSLTQWTWVWANSGRQWRTGKPGMLQSMGSQRVGQNLATEQQYTLDLVYLPFQLFKIEA